MPWESARAVGEWEPYLHDPAMPLEGMDFQESLAAAWRPNAPDVPHCPFPSLPGVQARGGSEQRNIRLQDFDNVDALLRRGDPGSMEKALEFLCSDVAFTCASSASPRCREVRQSVPLSARITKAGPEKRQSEVRNPLAKVKSEASVRSSDFNEEVEGCCSGDEKQDTVYSRYNTSSKGRARSARYRQRVKLRKNLQLLLAQGCGESHPEVRAIRRELG